jgi:hypothetical protein
MKDLKYEDRLGLIRGDFFLRSKEGKKKLRSKEFKKSLLKKIGKTGTSWKLVISGSPILIQFKKGVFIGFDNFLRGTLYEITKGKRVYERLPIHAVNKKGKTIILKIHLGRKVTPTVRDFKALLRMIEKEARECNIDLVRPKPHLDELERAIKVYDLRQEQIKQNRKDLKEIAREIFGDEDINAVRMVRHDYDNAVKMIGGDWEKLS